MEEPRRRDDRGLATRELAEPATPELGPERDDHGADDSLGAATASSPASSGKENKNNESDDPAGQASPRKKLPPSYYARVAGANQPRNINERSMGDASSSGNIVNSPGDPPLSMMDTLDSASVATTVTGNSASAGTGATRAGRRRCSGPSRGF